ncbi:MAG: hypothetical protein M1836_002566 [Candelina mexicana]|nr:MAG: hypothetical protein M1836_002566 [Candelina mexicana]
MTQSPPVNDKALYRFLVLIAIKLSKRYRPFSGSVLLISKQICIKYGRLVNLSEASTMRFISQHTSIPVPKVICAFTYHSGTYIVMERIDGDMVGRGWFNRNAESQTKVLSQLRRMIQEMRSLSPPQGQGVTNVDGGPLFDGRLPGPSLWFGPFSSIKDFHRHLRGGFEPNPKNSPEINKLIDLYGGHWPLVFTHGDLSSQNILVRGDKIVGIIDWETAGWFPAYWEYTTACQVNPQNSFWRDEIDRFLEPQQKELAMENIRQKYFGDF